MSCFSTPGLSYCIACGAPTGDTSRCDTPAAQANIAGLRASPELHKQIVEEHYKRNRIRLQRESEPPALSGPIKIS